MSARELKPCPFCGGIPKEIVDATRILGVHRIVHRCAVIPPFALEAATPEGVSEQWNRRADLPSGYVILSPDEVRTVERDRQAVEFAALWCWRTDPPNAHNKLTDAERLSVIKHHPTIKKYGKPHIELAGKEAVEAEARENYQRHVEEVHRATDAEIDAAIRSLKGGRDAQ